MSSDHSDLPIPAEQRNSARTTQQVGGLRGLDTDQANTEAQQFSFFAPDFVNCQSLRLPGITVESGHGPIAQRLEQQTHNLLVPGSNPGGPTNSKVSKFQSFRVSRFRRSCVSALSSFTLIALQRGNPNVRGFPLCAVLVVGLFLSCFY